MNDASSQNHIAEVLNKYSSVIYRICYMYMGNREDAEDVFQDVFVRYIQAQQKFENEEHEKAWLCKVAFNRCKDVLKSSAKKNHVNIEDIEEPSCEDEHPDHTVLEAVIGLPDKYKEVIYLFYYEDYSAAQIASILGSTENTVFSQLSRGRQLLKERLGDDFDNEKCIWC